MQAHTRSADDSDQYGYSRPPEIGSVAARMSAGVAEAEEAMADLLRLVPDETCTRIGERMGWPDNEYVERYLGGLRKNGLPE